MQKMKFQCMTAATEEQQNLVLEGQKDMKAGLKQEATMLQVQKAGEPAKKKNHHISPEENVIVPLQIGN